MKIRYRNAVTGEARDIAPGSAEETTVKTEVYTVNGESLPLWMLDGEYEKFQAREVEKANITPIFGHHSRRLTPGEIAMGITSYEQKVRENNPDLYADEEEEDDNEPLPEATTGATTPVVNEGSGLDDADEEDDDEDEEEDDDAAIAAGSPTTKRQPRRAPRRAPSRSR